MSDEVVRRTQTIDELAAKLHLPPAGLPALRGLTAEQAAFLGDLIEATRARRRAAVDAALERTIPVEPLRRAALAVLRRRRR